MILVFFFVTGFSLFVIFLCMKFCFCVDIVKKKFVKWFSPSIKVSVVKWVIGIDHLKQNQVLWNYHVANCIKMEIFECGKKMCGITEKSQGMQFGNIFLHDSEMFIDSDILYYGFDNYSIEEIVNKDEIYDTMSVDMGVYHSVDVYVLDGVSYPLKKGELDKVSIKIVLDDSVHAPIIK